MAYGQLAFINERNEMDSGKRLRSYSTQMAPAHVCRLLIAVAFAGLVAVGDAFAVASCYVWDDQATENPLNCIPDNLGCDERDQSIYHCIHDPTDCIAKGWTLDGEGIYHSPCSDSATDLSSAAGFLGLAFLIGWRVRRRYSPKV